MFFLGGWEMTARFVGELRQNEGFGKIQQQECLAVCSEFGNLGSF